MFLAYSFNHGRAPQEAKSTERQIGENLGGSTEMPSTWTGGGGRQGRLPGGEDTSACFLKLDRWGEAPRQQCVEQRRWMTLHESHLLLSMVRHEAWHLMRVTTPGLERSAKGDMANQRACPAFPIPGLLVWCSLNPRHVGSSPMSSSCFCQGLC
jgi:hypothetical protein